MSRRKYDCWPYVGIFLAVLKPITTVKWTFQIHFVWIMCSTREGHPKYPWGCAVPWGTPTAHMREISFVCYLSNVTCGYCTALPVLQVCLTSTGGLHCICKYCKYQFLLHSSGILQSTHSMKIYVLLHFEHKNDVTIVVTLLYRATSHRLHGRLTFLK